MRSGKQETAAYKSRQGIYFFNREEVGGGKALLT